MNIFQRAIDLFSNLFLTKPENKPLFLLGLSGGADSVFAFHVLLEMKKHNQLDFICAHFNHGWREEASADEKFCKDLGIKHDIKIITSSPEQLKKSFKFNGSKEEVGRNMRREFFTQIKDQNPMIKKIILAHHADDQIETFFIRLVRGCSLEGLCAMQKINGDYARPWLEIKKQEILDVLEEKKITWIQDQSNDSKEFLRNRIRHNLLPLLQKIDPRFENKISSSIKNLQQENYALDQVSKKAFSEIFTLENNVFIGSRKQLFKFDIAILNRVIILWLCHTEATFAPSQALITELLRFIRSERGGKHQIGHSWKIIKKSDTFFIEKD